MTGEALCRQSGLQQAHSADTEASHMSDLQLPRLAASRGSSSYCTEKFARKQQASSMRVCPSAGHV